MAISWESVPIQQWSSFVDPGYFVRERFGIRENLSSIEVEEEPTIVTDKSKRGDTGGESPEEARSIAASDNLTRIESDDV